MERIPCENQADCPLTGACREDTHHLYYPASNYSEYIAHRFRTLPSNTVQICRSEHERIHREDTPPEIPSIEFMAGYLLGQEHKLSVSAVKRIRQELKEHQRGSKA
jgi:hypothetical protein